MKKLGIHVLHFIVLFILLLLLHVISGIFYYSYQKRQEAIQKNQEAIKQFRNNRELFYSIKDSVMEYQEKNGFSYFFFDASGEIRNYQCEIISTVSDPVLKQLKQLSDASEQLFFSAAYEEVDGSYAVLFDFDMLDDFDSFHYIIFCNTKAVLEKIITDGREKEYEPYYKKNGSVKNYEYNYKKLEDDWYYVYVDE